MDSFKKFFKEKKVNKHFKRSGPGQRLCDGSSSPSSSPSVAPGTMQGGASGCTDRIHASDVAAQAALKRLYKEQPQQVSSSQKKIQMIAQRELEEERRRNMTDEQLSEELKHMGHEKHEPDVREFEHSDIIKGVFYTCELLGDDVAMTKQELQSTLGEFLREQVVASTEPGEAIVPAVVMLYSLNKKDVKDLAVETIGKYLQNIAEHPGEEKYTRIRLANKAFQERVASAIGGREYLTAAGFMEQQQSMKDGDPLEAFLVLPMEKAIDTGLIITALETLRDGQSVPLKVARDTQVFLLRDHERVTLPKLPADFFDLTASEVKKEQMTKTAEVERMTTMRTKEMRARDDLQRQYKYKYTLIRVRFPDKYVLQGTFGCYEEMAAVRAWVHSHCANEFVTFSLRDPATGAVLSDERMTLAESHLAPAAVIHVDVQDGDGLAHEWKEAATPFVAQ